MKFKCCKCLKEYRSKNALSQHLRGTHKIRKEIVTRFLHWKYNPFNSLKYCEKYLRDRIKDESAHNFSIIAIKRHKKVYDLLKDKTEYLNDNFDDIPITQRFYHFKNGEDIPKCLECSEVSKFNGYKNGYKKFCSKSCGSRYSNKGRVISEETKKKISEYWRKRRKPEKLKKYKCSKCERSFDKVNGISKHLKMTHGFSYEEVISVIPDHPQKEQLIRDKNYKCSVCNEKFISLSGLSTHLGRIHKIGEYEKKNYINYKEYEKYIKEDYSKTKNEKELRKIIDQRVEDKKFNSVHSIIMGNGHLIKIIEGYFNIDKTKLIQKIWHWYYKIKEIPKCPECDNQRKFSGFNRGYIKYCSQKCMYNDDRSRRIRKTCLEKYGVSNPGLIHRGSIYKNSYSQKATKYIENYIEENKIDPKKCYYGNDELVIYDKRINFNKGNCLKYDLIVFKDKESSKNKDLSKIDFILEYNGKVFHATEEDYVNRPNEIMPCKKETYKERFEYDEKKKKFMTDNYIDEEKYIIVWED